MQIDVIAFGILALAVYRLAYLAVKEDGPFGIFAGLRWLTGWRSITITMPSAAKSMSNKMIWFDVYWFDKPQWVLHIVKTPANILGCVYCASVWLGIAAAFGYCYAPTTTLWIALPFALSAGALVVHEKLVK